MASEPKKAGFRRKALNESWVLAKSPQLVLPGTKLTKAKKFISRPLILLGNSLTAIGCIGLLFAAFGLVDAEMFSVGISSGVRVIGSVAISGCLLSAIGYGLLEYFE